VACRSITDFKKQTSDGPEQKCNYYLKETKTKKHIGLSN
jgi:hypothetical protein